MAQACNPPPPRWSWSCVVSPLPPVGWGVVVGCGGGVWWWGVVVGCIYT